MNDKATNASILHRKEMGALPQRVLVSGASGGIGRAFCEALVQQKPDIEIIALAREPGRLSDLSNLTHAIAFDLLDTNSIDRAVTQLPKDAPVDWVFMATGWLHEGAYQPEKTYRALDSEQMLRAYQLNTIGPSLLSKALLGHFPKQHPMKMGILSARVGSISDNRLGGWHSYRASKAALNMMIKNFAIELDRSKRPVTICGLQPGTTATGLSAPFQRNVAPEDLQTPQYTANQLIKVMQALTAKDSGALFDFLGLRFEP